jgi:hypothetical protein
MKNASVRAPSLSFGRLENSTSITLQQNAFDIPLKTSNRYPYIPLEPSKNQIRILRRNSSKDAGPLNFTMQVVSLDTEPAYEALSYTWADETGNTDQDATVIIDGQTIAVTRSLEAALKAIFLDDATKILWVDAICINQVDVHEVNEQVRKMSTIYESASGVIAWLGSEYSNSPGAIKRLRNFNTKAVGECMYQTSGPWPDDLIPSEEVIHDIIGIVQLFSRAYWTRCWVVQEIAFAKSVVFRCGPETISFHDINIFSSPTVLDSALMIRALNIASVGYLLIGLYREGPIGIDHSDHTKMDASLTAVGVILKRHRRKISADPRDRIYSLVSLMAPEKQIRIPIDYSLETQPLFEMVATFIATEEKDLSILSENKTFCSIDSEGNKVNSYSSSPSWVPEWLVTATSDKYRIDEHDQSMGSSCLSMVGDSTIHGRTLVTRALDIGKITEVGKLMPGEHPDLEYLEFFDPLYKWWSIFHSLENRDMFGKNGFTDLVNYGDYYKQCEIFPDLAAVHNKNLSRQLTILFSVYFPNDTTWLPNFERETLITEEVKIQAESALWRVIRWCGKRKLIVLENSVAGMGPQCTEAGDIVAIIPGCKVPVVLRKAGGASNEYYNVGDCYVENTMDGQAMKDIESGLKSFQTIKIL